MNFIKYESKTASKNHICSDCNFLIKKGVTYYKYESAKIYDKKCISCYIKYCIDILDFNVNEIKGIII